MKTPRYRWLALLTGLGIGNPAAALAQNAPAPPPLLSIASPDPRITEAFEHSRANLERQLGCDTPAPCGPADGVAMATLGLTAVGAFNRARAVLASQAARQDQAGRIADGIGPEATPAWLVAAQQYWSASGDDAFLERFWPNFVQAMRWAASTDRNADGLMDNAAAAPAGALTDTLLTDIHLAAFWVAALDAMQQLAHGAEDEGAGREAQARARRAQARLDESFWLDSLGFYGAALVRRQPADTVETACALTAWPAAAIAFGLLDADRSARMLERLGSAAVTADWGVRVLAQGEPDFDAQHYSRGAVWPYLTGVAAHAHYQHHRAWAGFDLLRDLARLTLDFVRGRTPELVSGATYTTLVARMPPQALASSTFITALVRGLVGWQADAHNRAAALEPHLPGAWRSFSASNLRIGRDRIDIAISREPGVYTINLHRLTAGTPLSLRVAPALPLGARLDRVVVNDADVPVQAEESAHDLHGVAEVVLARDAHVEFHYSGGVEVVTPRESLQPGDSARALKVLSFRRAGREFSVELEGLAGTTDTLHLRSETRIRAVRGSDSYQQTHQRVMVVVTLPPGTGFVRKALRVRT